MNQVTYPRHKIVAALEESGIGHSLPQAAPQVFAGAAVDILGY